MPGVALIVLIAQGLLAWQGIAATHPAARVAFLVLQGATLLAVLLRYRRDATPIRRLWLLLAWAVGMQVLWALINLVAELAGDPHGWLTTLGVVCSGLYMIPCMLLIARGFDQREPPRILVLDLALSLVVAILLCTMVLRIIGQVGGPTTAGIELIIEHADAIDFSLAVLASLRLVGLRSVLGRAFYACASLFLWINAIAAAIYNRVELTGLPPWSAPMIGVAYAALTIAVSRPAPRFLRRGRPTRAVAQVIGSFAPVGMSLAVVLLAISVSRVHFRLGLVGAVVAVLLYALRVAVIQSRSQDLQREAQLSNHRLQEQVGRDPLTGLANRTVLDATLQAIARAGHIKACAVLMVDIDHFKQYNDSLGHLAGDTCLIRVAGLLAEAITQPGALVARYGGEEFAIVLIGAGSAEAEEAAGRAIAAVERAQLPHGCSPYGCVTVSIGIAVQCAGGPAIALLQEADRAMYGAKALGRNRHALADDTAGNDIAPVGALP